MSFMGDSTLIFSDDQDITATAISENVVQNLTPTPATLHNQPAALTSPVEAGSVPIAIQVTETFADNTSLTVTLESDSAAGLDSSPTVHWSSGAIPVADLVAGYQFSLDHLPRGNYGAYTGLRYTIGGSNATAGQIHAAIQDRGQSNLNT